jgi:hypothetical protein
MIVSRKIRLAGYAAQMEEKRNEYRILVGKRPLGRPRCRWVDSNKIDLREIEWHRMD